MSEAIEKNKYSITLEQARELVEALEGGNQDQADAIMSSIYHNSEHNMFTAVGELTRDLHDAIMEFADNPRIKSITQAEMSDAAERLRTIMRMTDRAANLTIDAVEHCSPKAEALIAEIDTLAPLWNQLMRGHIDKHAFVLLCHRIDELLSSARTDAQDLSNKLTEIVMAQDYQDLTGQVLQKVISLVAELEDRLVMFLLRVAPYVSESSPPPADDADTAREDALVAEGPILDKHKEAKNVASGQDEVDDILASLGF